MGVELAAVLSDVRHFRMTTINPRSFDPLGYAEKIAALSIEHCICYEPHRGPKLCLDSIGTKGYELEISELDFYSIQIRRNLPPIVTKLSLEAGSELGSKSDLFEVNLWSDWR
jgi:hypothetical protein